MKLITAHRILIASAAVFFLFFSAWELARYFNRGEGWAAGRSLLYLVIAVGFSIYFKSLKRWYR
ncbi:MAG TPA: hypothetical protein VNN77_17880 [candidate division Zixibacteria bacterium]|nr:hypothetical protein [candidate division Zixibacteria bacterium]